MVQLLIISDLHFDLITQNPANRHLFANFMRALKIFLLIQKVDALLIAGDVSNSNIHVVKFFKKLQDIKIPIVFVPGNHELQLDVELQIDIAETDPLQQIEFGMIDRGVTGDSYDNMIELQEQIASYGVQMLLDKPIKLVDDPRIFIFGNIGWYNYELPFREGAISPKIIDKKYDHTLFIAEMKERTENPGCFQQLPRQFPK